MRDPVRRLLELGPMPPDDTATEAQVRAFEAAVDDLEAASPASDEEAAALTQILPASEEQSLFGIAWGVLHVIETAPSWPIVSSLKPPTGWKRTLWRRCANARRLPCLPDED